MSDTDAESLSSFDEDPAAYDDARPHHSAEAYDRTRHERDRTSPPPSGRASTDDARIAEDLDFETYEGPDVEVGDDDLSGAPPGTSSD